MGGIDPLTALSVLQTGVGLIQQRQQVRAQNAGAEAAAQSQIQQIRRAQEIRERERRERLRRALATQRAQFGSQGLGRGGSAEAVLKGLATETDRANQDDRSLNVLRIGDINRTLNQRRRRSLLDASNFRRRTTFGLLERGLNGFSLLER